MQLVITDLIGPGKNNAVKGRSIQDNLHLVRRVLERIKDDAKAPLINLDQSKSFDRVDHRFLATVLETAGFQPERNWLGIRAKVEAQVGTWLRRPLSIKGRAEVCAVYIFPLIFYRVSVSHCLSGVIESQWSLDSSATNDLEMGSRDAQSGESLAR